MSQCKIDVMQGNQEPIYINVNIPWPKLVLLNIIVCFVDQIVGRIKQKEIEIFPAEIISAKF